MVKIDNLNGLSGEQDNENSILSDNEHKIIKIIASCETIDQLKTTQAWYYKIANKASSLDLLMIRGLGTAYQCKQLDLMKSGLTDYETLFKKLQAGLE